MAVNNAAVILPAEGRFYIAPTSETKPTALTAPTGGWVEVGHTTFEDPLVIERDGGDSTVLRSWQASALRTSTEGITYKLTFNAAGVGRPRPEPLLRRRRGQRDHRRVRGPEVAGRAVEVAVHSPHRRRADDDDVSSRPWRSSARTTSRSTRRSCCSFR